MGKSDVYFAAEEDAAKLVGRILARIEAHRSWLKHTGRHARATRAWSAYYGTGPDGDMDSSDILEDGEQGEIKRVTANLFGVLVRQVMRLLTGQKPAFKTVAETSDSAAIVQSQLGDSLLEYYDRRMRVAELEAEAVLAGLLTGSGWVVQTWATDQGEEIGVNPDTNKVVHEGDLSMRVLTVWDVACDTQDSPEQRQWVAFRVPAKRFDLVARYPTMRDEILHCGGDGDATTSADGTPSGMGRATGGDVCNEDTVWLWEFRHVPSAALPNGRLVRFLDAKTVLWDSARAAVQAAPAVAEGGEESEDAAGEAVADTGYPYPGLLAEEYSPERRVGLRADAHSAQWDTLSLQKALDLVTTAIVTNANVGSLVNVWTGPQVDGSPPIERLDSGLNIVKSVVKPEVLNLLNIPSELVGLGGLLSDYMQQINGLNDVVMGETPSGMPAQLAALLEAKAVQYHQAGQAAYYRMVEANRTGMLQLLKRFGASKRTAHIVGKANSWMLKEWSAEDIKGLQRVAVEPVNPIMRTLGGRQAFADNLQQRFPLSMTVDDYTSVYLTGELHEILDARKSRLGRLARTKEMLAEGVGLPPVDLSQMPQLLPPGAPPPEPVFVDDGQPHVRPLLFDRHWEDIPEYLSVLESPEARDNPVVTEAVLGVVAECLRLWRAMPPDMLQVLGAPMPMMPPLPPGGDGPGAPALGSEAAPDVELPKPPPNPVTGEQAPPPVTSPAPTA